jgi:hypothetical protein
MNGWRILQYNKSGIVTAITKLPTMSTWLESTVRQCEMNVPVLQEWVQWIPQHKEVQTKPTF